MNTEAFTENATRLAVAVAPEDLGVGDYVTVLNEIAEYPSFLWNNDGGYSASTEPVRVQWRAFGGGMPFRVKAICLPFALLKNPKGKHKTVDLRGCQLVRLSLDYARAAWLAMRKKKKRKTSR